jgi:hypothetical protein
MFLLATARNVAGNKTWHLLTAVVVVEMLEKEEEWRTE